MRKVDKFENVNEESFKRLVGVKRSTFEVMVNEYKKQDVYFSFSTCENNELLLLSDQILLLYYPIIYIKKLIFIF
jgi:hypothetical protein